MLEHLCGPIASVMAQMTDKTYGAYSTVAVALEFANGAVGTLLGSTTRRTPTRTHSASR